MTLRLTTQSRIPEEFIESVRAVSPVEQVVGEYVQLRRSGVELRGRCPFHADKAPSLYVRPAKGVFHCHGCGAGGDVFEFVRLLHHCSFGASVKLLAARAGIRLEGFRPSPELTARISALKAHHERELAFKRFCDERLDAINQHYRALSRTATHAEDYLRFGIRDPYLEDLAWSALERFRMFESRVEREGLCDQELLKNEWSKLSDAA